jgi:hypothetical protein
MRSAIVAFVCLAALGCGIKKSKEDAERIVARHYESIAAHAYEAVLADYDEQFFEKTPRDGWVDVLKKVEAKLGTYESYKIAGWNARNNFGTNAGSYVTIGCDVKYAQHEAEEQMILFRRDDRAEFKIMKHGINSEWLLKD